MKFSAKFVFVCTVVIWVLLVLPFFIPALNRIDPKVLGLPFVVFWQYALIAAHIVLLVFSAYKVWDPFDAVETEEKKEDEP